MAASWRRTAVGAIDSVCRLARPHLCAASSALAARLLHRHSRCERMSSRRSIVACARLARRDASQHRRGARICRGTFLCPSIRRCGDRTTTALRLSNLPGLKASAPGALRCDPLATAGRSGRPRSARTGGHDEAHRARWDADPAADRYVAADSPPATGDTGTSCRGRADCWPTTVSTRVWCAGPLAAPPAGARTGGGCRSVSPRARRELVFEGGARRGGVRALFGGDTPAAGRMLLPLPCPGARLLSPT